MAQHEKDVFLYMHGHWQFSLLGAVYFKVSEHFIDEILL